MSGIILFNRPRRFNVAAFLLTALPMGTMAKPDEVSAIKKAGNMGANHIVWDRFSLVGCFNGIAVVKAYNRGE